MIAIHSKHRRTRVLQYVVLLASLAAISPLAYSQIRAEPTGRPRVGLALEGGGALGFAHIGVLQWMEDHHIPVDSVAGTSMGALIGGLYASGESASELNTLATSTNFNDIFTLSVPYSDVNFRRRQDESEMPGALQFGLKGGVGMRNALVQDSTLNSFLRARFLAYNSNNLDYDKLPIPFRCVATDLNTMRPVVFSHGPLPVSIRASISIPAVFSPVEYQGHYLSDGAIMNNLPTDIVKRDLHADLVIAVHLDSSAFSPSDVNSIVGVFARAYAAGVVQTERSGKALADVLVSVDLNTFSTADYGKAKELIAAGYQAADAQKEKLLPHSLNEAEWEQYLHTRQARERPAPGLLQAIEVQGGSKGAEERVRNDLASLQGKKIKGRAVSTALLSVQGSGAYQATYETFSPQAPASNTGVQSYGPDTGVRVRLSDARNEPPFLLFGEDITAATGNVNHQTFDIRVVDQNFGGYGSELRADVRLGFLTQTSLEYYRALTPSGYFLQPHLGLLRQPVYLWQNQQRVSEWFSQDAGGGLDLGRTFNRNLQAALEWRAQTVRWHLKLGQDGSPAYSGTTQTAVARITYNSATSEFISPKGWQLEMKAGALYHSLGVAQAPMTELSVAHSFSFHESNVIGLSFAAHSHLRNNVPQPLRFTLGGPLNLSASSIDEYRGTDTGLVRAGYLRRVADLPAGLGEGLYVSFGYEAGEVWSPEHPAILRQDGLLMGIAATPIGLMKFGGAVGDAGRRKIFFSFGRVF